MNKNILLSILVLATSFPAFAEDIKIHADKQVEWHSKEQKMVAVGNAVASKNDMSIKAQELTAKYEKNAQSGKQEISEIHASEDVLMTNGKSKAYGHEMIYNLKEDKAVLYGSPAKITTENNTITAEKHITYYPTDQKAVAEGNVFASDGENDIYTDSLIAYFTKDKDGKTSLKQAKAFGHVKIVNKDGTVWADKGTYLPKANMIKLYDNVTIDQKGNVIHGDYAETNTLTGISKMKAGNKNGRVSGVFKEKNKKSEKQK